MRPYFLVFKIKGVDICFIMLRSSIAHAFNRQGRELILYWKNFLWDDETNKDKDHNTSEDYRYN